MFRNICSEGFKGHPRVSKACLLEGYEALHRAPHLKSPKPLTPLTTRGQSWGMVLKVLRCTWIDGFGDGTSAHRVSRLNPEPLKTLKSGLQGTTATSDLWDMGSRIRGGVVGGGGGLGKLNTVVVSLLLL